MHTQGANHGAKKDRVTSTSLKNEGKEEAKKIESLARRIGLFANAVNRDR